LAALAVPGYPGGAMRRLVLTAVIALVTAAGAAGSTRPQVALLQASPVAIGGTGFQPGRAVTVTYSVGSKRITRVAKPGARGGFTLVLRGVSFDRCRGASVRAAGAAALVVLPCTAPGGKPSIGGTIAGFVRGAAFVPGEHVRVTGRVSDADPVTAIVDAAENGSFALRLDLPSSRCGELFYRAVGSLGSTATFTFDGPACKTP
jgi:hypothetical protein